MERGFERYKQGIQVTGFELNDSLRHLDVILEDVKSERAVAQFDLEKELHFKKVARWVSPDESRIKIIADWGRYEGN